jgi:tetratricopeptide (TPR) repeat protein
MASIFLSYAREDAVRAKAIAEGLEGDGHSVWWDRRLGAGSSFSLEITAALRSAELVLVLWSRHSAQSPWVLDEAGVGRDSGKLVPVLLEPIDPPLGFRQYQAVDLTKARGKRALLQLHEAIEARLTGAQVPNSTPRKKFISPRTVMFGLGVPAALVITVAAYWWWPVDDGVTSVAVAAAQGETSGPSVEFARSVAVDLGRYRAGPAGNLAVVDAASGKAKDVDYLVEVGIDGNDKDLRAEASLKTRKGDRLLWSAVVAGQGRPLVDVRQEVAATIGDVLRCLAELDDGGGAPNPDIEGLYLTGCASQEVSEKEISVFRRITTIAPEFGPGWANLALVEQWTLPTATPGDRSALLADIRDHLARAKKLAPDFPETIVAEAQFRPGDANRIPAAMAVLDRGIRRHPESALLHSLRAELLLGAGRMRDAVAESKRASELNPLSTAMRDSYISALAYSGRTDQAFDELKQAESIWPGSNLLRDVRFRLLLRFGDPSEALQMLSSNGPRDSTSDPTDEAWRLFLLAREDPSPAKIEAALASYRARYRRNPADIPGYIQALGTFGRVDEAYRAAQSGVTIDSMFVSTDVLFRPFMRPIRNDSRFIALSARLGLLQFWEKNGIWPDFCSDPQLPYDCLHEAAKLTATQRKPAPALS